MSARSFADDHQQAVGSCSLVRVSAVVVSHQQQGGDVAPVVSRWSAGQQVGDHGGRLSLADDLGGVSWLSLSR